MLGLFFCVCAAYGVMSAVHQVVDRWRMTREIRVESRMLGDFGPDSPLVQTRSFMEERFGGVAALELILRGKDERVMDLEVLRGVEGLLEALPEVEELNIGHAIVADAIFKGLQQAVADFRAVMVR